MLLLPARSRKASRTSALKLLVSRRRRLHHRPRLHLLSSSRNRKTERGASSSGRPTTTISSSPRGLPARLRAKTLSTSARFRLRRPTPDRRLLALLRCGLSILLRRRLGRSRPLSSVLRQPATAPSHKRSATSPIAAFRRRLYAIRRSMRVSALSLLLRPRLPSASNAENPIDGSRRSSAANAAATCTPFPVPASKIIAKRPISPILAGGALSLSCHSLMKRRRRLSIASS